MEKIVVIGLGLIGGSLALDLKKRGNYKVFGIDQNPEHIKKALELGIIDEAIGLSEIANVRIGKHITLEVSADNEDVARAKVDEACKKLLCNQTVESYSFELSS